MWHRRGKKLSGLNANLDGGRKEYIIGEESTLINRGKLIAVGNKFKGFPQIVGVFTICMEASWNGVMTFMANMQNTH